MIGFLDCQFGPLAKISALHCEGAQICILAIDKTVASNPMALRLMTKETPMKCMS